MNYEFEPFFKKRIRCFVAENKINPKLVPLGAFQPKVQITFPPFKVKLHV